MEEHLGMFCSLPTTICQCLFRVRTARVSSRGKEKEKKILILQSQVEEEG